MSSNSGILTSTTSLDIVLLTLLISYTINKKSYKKGGVQMKHILFVVVLTFIFSLTACSKEDNLNELQALLLENQSSPVENFKLLDCKVNFIRNVKK